MRVIPRLGYRLTEFVHFATICSRFAAQIVDCIGRQIAPNTLEYADFHPPNFASSVTQEHPIERLGRISAFGRCWQMTAGDAGLETKVEITPAGDLLSTARLRAASEVSNPCLNGNVHADASGGALRSTRGVVFLKHRGRPNDLLPSIGLHLSRSSVYGNCRVCDGTDHAAWRRGDRAQTDHAGIGRIGRARRWPGLRHGTTECARRRQTQLRSGAHHASATRRRKTHSRDQQPSVRMHRTGSGKSIRSPHPR